MKSQEELLFPTAKFQNECCLREPLETWLDPSYFSFGEERITTREVCVVSVSAGTHRVSVIWAGPAFSLHVERRICHSLFPPSLLSPSKLNFSLVVNSTSPKRLCKNSWDQPSVCCELHAICASQSLSVNSQASNGKLLIVRLLLKQEGSLTKALWAPSLLMDKELWGWVLHLWNVSRALGLFPPKQGSIKTALLIDPQKPGIITSDTIVVDPTFNKTQNELACSFSVQL